MRRVSINKLVTVNCDGWLLATETRAMNCEGEWGDGFYSASEADETIRADGWRVFANGYTLCPACAALNRGRVKWVSV